MAFQQNSFQQNAFQLGFGTGVALEIGASVSGYMTSKGYSLLEAIDVNGAGVLGTIASSFSVLGTMDTNGFGVNGPIDVNGYGVAGAF